MEHRASVVRRRDVIAGVTALAITGRVAAGRAPAAVSAYWPGVHAWETAMPAAAGFDPAKLEDAIAPVLARDSYSLLILRHGRIVSEHYGHGAAPNDAHEIASVAKSVVSLLVGIAIDAGKIASVDQPAAAFIPSWRGTPKQAISIRHLLTMTAGLAVAGLKVRDVEGDQFALNAAAPLVHPPGTHWAYATPSFHLLYHILEAATGEPFRDFARRVLLAPMGAENWTWLTSVGRSEKGPVTNYYSALCTARDLARLGLLALHGGRWNDRQLVSPDYFRASISPSQALNPAYGYLWWTNAEPGLDAWGRGPLLRNFGKVPSDTFGALGHGGQVVIAIPSRSLVVVRQGTLGRTPMRPDWMIEPIVAALA